MLEQHRGLILSGGVLMDEIDHTEQFQNLLATLLVPIKSKKESLKRETIKTCRMYLELFKVQILDRIKDKVIKTNKMS
jgi:hypothetical protein